MSADNDLLKIICFLVVSSDIIFIFLLHRSLFHMPSSFSRNLFVFQGLISSPLMLDYQLKNVSSLFQLFDRYHLWLENVIARYCFSNLDKEYVWVKAWEGREILVVCWRIFYFSFILINLFDIIINQHLYY